ncbi:LysR family transcriptional regulator [uncultured Cohaesibacter sp.]|uniref:LysR family transcriptional regulator n=1 Tax=uncultured Cohaesibacter sp. TaxID=1002546 RepID=UPI00292E0381|nr:LysR family transcriptional regulator [uncultured Cohaesibacter sp.]
MEKIDLNLLRSLQALLQTSNVTQAAESLSLSQSAMSYNLARLRTLLGDEILTRQGVHMVKTPYAQSLQEPLGSILSQIDELFRKDVPFDLSQCAETFSIALPDVGEADFAPMLLLKVRQEAPNLKLKLIPIGSLNIQDSLDDGTIHLAIGAYLEGRAHHKRRLLFYEQFLSLYNPDLIDRANMKELKSWQALPHIVVTESKGEPDPLRLALGREEQKINVVATSSRIMLFPLLLKDAPLVATLPESLATRFAKMYGLETAKPPVEMKEVPIMLLWHQSYDTSPAHTWLRKTICDSFRPS